MTGLRIENSAEKLILSIDKNHFSEEVLINVIKIARLEYLIEKAAFDPSVQELDEELKQNWWDEHQEEIKKIMK